MEGEAPQDRVNCPSKKIITLGENIRGDDSAPEGVTLATSDAGWGASKG